MLTDRLTDDDKMEGTHIGIYRLGNCRNLYFRKVRRKVRIIKISLIAKLRMYILETVRMSLLNSIMMRMMVLLVVPNIKGTAYTGTSY